MKVIHHHPGMAQRDRQRAGIPAPGVQRDRADAGQPATRSGTKPAVHGGPGAVGHHIQQPATLQIDQTGDPSGRRGRGCPKKTRLIQTEGRHAVQTSGVIDQLGAVVNHRSHDGRPANAEVAGDRDDRVGVLANPPTRLGAGPFGQHRPGTDRGRSLGPGPHPTGRLPTAPDPLAPGQHDRSATNRQVTHPDRASAMEFGPHPTAPTTDHGGGGLDDKLPLAGHHLGGENLKAVQVEQPGG